MYAVYHGGGWCGTFYLTTVSKSDVRTWTIRIWSVLFLSNCHLLRLGIIFCVINLNWQYWFWFSYICRCHIYGRKEYLALALRWIVEVVEYLVLTKLKHCSLISSCFRNRKMWPISEKENCICNGVHKKGFTKIYNVSLRLAWAQGQTDENWLLILSTLLHINAI